MPHDIRAELFALQDDLAIDPAPDQSTSSENADNQKAAKWTEIERALRELQSHLNDATGEAEDLLTEHPFAAVAAAFVLGIIAGRTLGFTK